MNTLQAEQVLLEKDCQIVDVRSEDEFLREHIPHSINIPLDALAEHCQKNKTGQKNNSELNLEQKIILTCRSGNRAKGAQPILESLGYMDLSLLEGGLMGWKAAGQETISLKKGISIMRQVQIIAGLLILSGFFVPLLWFLVPMVGVGMLLAGLSNSCMIAIILQKMPWNTLDKNQGGDASGTCSIASCS